MNIYLTGYMGSGKTTVGQALADVLHRPFLDSDHMITERTGRTIPELFEKEGETEFRLIEKRVIRDIAKRTNHVIALGGGAILSEENRNHLSETGTTVALLFPPEVLMRRLIFSKSRPLLNGTDGKNRLEKIRTMLQHRDRYYRMADLIFESTMECSVDAIVREIIKRLGPAND